MEPKVSYAQNAEDIRVWRAFHALPNPPLGRGDGLTYVDVGANEPRHLSITASLYDLGWRGLLIEADPALASDLRTLRPGDTVVECAASDSDGTLTFTSVPGTGLGTLNEGEAEAAAGRGFETTKLQVQARRLDSLLPEHLAAGVREIHFMSIDVEGAEALVLEGLSLRTFRPWVLCIEAVRAGTEEPSHQGWEPQLLRRGYLFAAFDGVNRWYVASEHDDLVPAIATPFNSLDAGMHGWVQADQFDLRQVRDRAHARRAWQRELILHDVRAAVPVSEYEKQILELRTALAAVEGSRSWRVTRKAAKAVRLVQHGVRRAILNAPGPLQRVVIRERHLRHVTANLPNLVDPGYLGKAPAETVDWITPAGLPSLPGTGTGTGVANPARGGFGLTPLTAEDMRDINAWLDAGPYDDDATLDRRTDNHDDELGRLIAALRTRLRLARVPEAPTPANGNRVLFDARSLQSAAFGTRGIGRFASSALLGLRGALGDEKIVLLVDRGLELLPADLAGSCEQVTRVTQERVPGFSVLIEPSPLTASPEPLIPILRSTAHRIAIVFDFIPMHYPTIYLRHAAARVEYAAGLDALRTYDEFICISHLVKEELSSVLGRNPEQAHVAWPAAVSAGAEPSEGPATGPIVVMTGDEGRKNTYGALAAIGAATAGRTEPRSVLVIGMAGQETRVHHWSIHAAMRPGEAITAGRLSEAELHETLRTASLVVVASFDEGLSLPVIEAINAGANVVASDIPAHRELIGRGPYLVDPRRIRRLSRAIRRYSGTRRGFARQQARLAAHQHGDLERVIVERTLARLGTSVVALPAERVHVEGRDLRIALATPYPPQKSGIADFSAAIADELNGLCDLTVYTTADARVPDTITHARIDSVLALGSSWAGGHDAFVTVLGNSHFHVPFLEVMKTIDAVAVLHDTRMVELYIAMRGPGGVEQVMTRGAASSVLSPSLIEQIDDMRLLQNMGFWEIAHRARALIMHSPSAAPLVQEQTGVTPLLLPFANYRAPNPGEVTGAMRQSARERLGFATDAIHLGSFGFIDVRTKLVDVIVESAAWLTAWGHRVSLHLVGSASEAITEELTIRARNADLAGFEITGFVSDARFRDYVTAVDLGVQLRVSPLLGVSGPLSDMAAVGTPAVASRGLAIDVDTPGFIDRLPDESSPLMVAEAIEYRLAHPVDRALVEQQRVEYLARKSPRVYAEELLGLLARM